jgi:hypothetical protein
LPKLSLTPYCLAFLEVSDARDSISAKYFCLFF